MHNDLLTIGKFTIHGYGLMIGIGFAAAYLVTEYRARKRGMDTDMVYILFFSSIIFGLLGAKLCYYLTILDELLKDFSLLLSEGFVVYGGIIGGVLAGYVACRIKKQDFWKYFDLVAPAIALAQGFGRIGCFLAGCCYGKETESVFSVIFQNSEYAPNHVALIPTQLYSSGLDFLHFLLLLLIARNKKEDGQVTACYLIFYSIGRFVIEFFRGDIIRGSVGILSTSQFISIFTGIAGIVLLIRIRKKRDSKSSV